MRSRDASPRGPRGRHSERELTAVPLYGLPAPRALQPALAIGAADDPFEREAERTADAVMASPEGPSRALGGGSIAASLLRFVRRASRQGRVPGKEGRRRAQAPAEGSGRSGSGSGSRAGGRGVGDSADERGRRAAQPVVALLLRAALRLRLRRRAPAYRRRSGGSRRGSGRARLHRGRPRLLRRRRIPAVERLGPAAHRARAHAHHSAKAGGGAGGALASRRRGGCSATGCPIPGRQR